MAKHNLQDQLAARWAALCPCLKPSQLPWCSISAENFEHPTDLPYWSDKLTEQEITSIKERNQKRLQIKQHITPGPWYVSIYDDKEYMSLVAVTLTEDSINQPDWLQFDPTVVIAATLVQAPRYVSIRDEKWEKNAHFIAFARNDDVEHDVQLLLDEIERLKTLLK